jgi:hypothetical protein
MRALVIVHERDMPNLQDTVLEGASLSPDLFPPEVAAFDLVRLATDATGRTTLIEESGDRMPPEKVGQSYSTVVVIAGTHASGSASLFKLLQTFLRGRHTPDWSNEAVIILRLAQIDRRDLKSMPPERVFYCPSDDLGEVGDAGSPRWRQRIAEELRGLLLTLDENQTRNPNVGFGLLLVDRNCNLFLMERLRGPGKGRFGTIGGAFYRGRDIVPQLESLLARRFRRRSVPEVDLGPLLACTNMKSSFLHYVDLTFLAVLRDGSLSEVADDELSPLGEAALAKLPESSSRSGTRLMFTLPEVAIFHRAGLLFAPVANAFESFCRCLFAEQVRRGRHRTVQVPSLTDDTQTFTIHLPSDDTIHDVATAIRPWSRTAIPFFEGMI